jgi:hypothetical protein
MSRMERTPTPATEHSKDNEAQEIDVWWGGYAGRTMVPSFVLCGVLTAGIVIIAWSLGGWHGSSLTRYSAQLSIGAIWVVQIARWVYRIVTINYRLTSHRLYCERGFHHPGSPGIELASISDVVVEQSALERFLRVGRIRIVAENNPALPLVLEGVWDPEHVAKEVRKRLPTVTQSLRRCDQIQAIPTEKAPR